MKRTYWVKRGNFANEYTVCYADTPEQKLFAEVDNFEQINREEAFILVRRERRRRRENPSFSGYASAVILPVDYTGDWQNDGRAYRIGCIVEFH